MPKFALRRTQGPTNACINFHCDGPYASSTIQIPLNDLSACHGGRLIMYSNGNLFTPLDRAGCMTRHDRSVLHAVTPFIRGVRKSFFVVDQNNGLGEALNGSIHTISDEDIQTFSDTQSNDSTVGDFSDGTHYDSTSAQQELQPLPKPPQQQKQEQKHDQQRQKNYEEQSQTQPSHCVICYEQMAYIAIVPCGHMCICRECSEKFRFHTCPICIVT